MPCPYGRRKREPSTSVGMTGLGEWGGIKFENLKFQMRLEAHDEEGVVVATWVQHWSHAVRPRRRRVWILRRLWRPRLRLPLQRLERWLPCDWARCRFSARRA